MIDMTLSEKEAHLLAGGKLKVKAWTGKVFYLGIHQASLGVRFLCAYQNGRRIRNASCMWNTWTATDWLDHMEVIEKVVN